MSESTVTTTTLTKFKIVKFGVEAEYTDYEAVEGTRLATEVSKKYPFQPKDELLEAFKKLVPHLLMLCEFVDDSQVDTVPQVLDDYARLAESFKVTGFVVKESGVTLIGRRILKGKKVLNLTTPFLLWETPEGMDDTYAFMHTFQHDIGVAQELALAYLDGDYLRQAAQLSLEFDNPVD